MSERASVLWCWMFIFNVLLSTMVNALNFQHISLVDDQSVDCPDGRRYVCISANISPAPINHIFFGFGGNERCTGTNIHNCCTYGYHFVAIEMSTIALARQNINGPTYHLPFPPSNQIIAYHFIHLLNENNNKNNKINK